MKPLPPDMTQWVHALRQAAQAGDWPQLTQLDRQLHAYLLQPDRVHEREVLQALRSAYVDAMAICAAHGISLKNEMARLACSREGQQAYAQFSETEWT
jgi:phosphoribosylaminoimidazole (AIR) synthetase